MKKVFYLILGTVFILSLSSAIEVENCDSKTLKKEGIKELNPFYYSASKVNIINYDYKAYRKEIEVPLFKGEKYKLVFNKKGLPKDVLVEIFEKNKMHKSRSSVFTTKGNTSDVVSFMPKKSKKLYVSYTVPASKGEKDSGCLVFILGYQLTFLDNSEKKEEAK